MVLQKHLCGKIHFELSVFHWKSEHTADNDNFKNITNFEIKWDG